MNPRILFILRFIFGFSFVGIAVVQVLLLIKLITDSANGGELSPLPLIILVSLLILLMGLVEFVIFCIFKLLNLVHRDEIFDQQAIAWVDRVTASIAIAAFVVLPMAYIVAELDDAPGMVIVGLVVAMLVMGVALLVNIMRMLLARAIGFSTELEAVI
ncbi:DUF2975 domain-containing protein [Corynebacterium callunae]|uniref:DUF2975 domain-containing protein n=1 Tax=Corynebacterium callunae TaxID=1721 RepID=UPI00200006C1|nr:DUF2975 domain-containing protein [Corynebacterium callunae]